MTLSNNQRKNENYLFTMPWGTNQAGYEIVPADIPNDFLGRATLLGHPPSTRLEDMIRPKEGGGYDGYDPFKDCPTVARRFSMLTKGDGQVSYDKALKFANKHGLLGLDGEYGMKEESLKRWTEIASMFQYIFSLIDKEARDDALNYFNGVNDAPAIRLWVTNDKKIWKRSLQVRPTSLYGAMWLMVADEISRGIQNKKCEAEGCDGWFPIRSKKKYCSGACNAAAYRKRKVS